MTHNVQSMKVTNNLPFPFPMTGINFLLAFININTSLRVFWIQLVASPAYWMTREAAWIIYTPLTWIAVVSSKCALIFIYKQ
jgi:hypothetical protein